MLRAFSSLSLALRGLLVVAMLAIAPLYESAHAMTVTTTTHAAMPDMAAHDMSAGSMQHQTQAAHSSHDAACRILCFGWVEAVTPERGGSLVPEVAVILTPAAVPLLDGIVPAPSGHPPKLVRLV